MTREEALKILRSTHDKALFSVRNALETLIPELTESEDERMVKAILSAIRGGLDTEKFLEKHGTNYEEVEAYLEKQKHCWKPTETDAVLFNIAVTTNETLTSTQRAQLEVVRSKFGCCSAVDCSGIEQKPAEWSEEDEDYMKDLMDYFGYNLPLEHTPRAVRDWLKSLHPSWKPSEEQIYSLGTVVNGMGESAFGVSKNLRDLYEQLKKL